MATPSTARDYAELGEQVRQRLAPAVLSNLQTNADRVAHYVKRNQLNSLSADDVVSAIWAVNAEQQPLLWDIDPVAPKQKSQEQLAAEFQAREQQRVLRDQIANSIPFDHSKQIEAAKAAEEEAKRQEAAKETLNSLIHQYTVNGLPGRIDYGKTEAGQAALRGIQIKRNGKVDWLLTLRVVQAAYNNDSPREIIQAAERALENYKNYDEKEKARIRSEERRFGR
jgi:hypothetical protein